MPPRNPRRRGLRQLVLALAAKTSAWQAARESGVPLGTVLDWIREETDRDAVRQINAARAERRRQAKALMRAEATRQQRAKWAAERAERRAKARAKANGEAYVAIGDLEPTGAPRVEVIAAVEPPRPAKAPKPAPVEPSREETVALLKQTVDDMHARAGRGNDGRHKTLLVQVTEAALERMLRELPTCALKDVQTIFTRVMDTLTTMHAINMSYVDVVQSLGPASAPGAVPALGEFSDSPDDLPS